MMRQENPLSGRRTVIVCMMLLIAALHLFRVGSYLEGGLFNFYYSYFSDFALPFGGYFLLFMAESQVPVLKFWQSKMAVAFLVPSVAETCQFQPFWSTGRCSPGYLNFGLWRILRAGRRVANAPLDYPMERLLPIAK
jgi:hypothetical protein